MTFGLKPEGEYATSPIIYGGKDNWIIRWSPKPCNLGSIPSRRAMCTQIYDR